jgi:hypothetical protein
MDSDDSRSRAVRVGRSTALDDMTSPQTLDEFGLAPRTRSRKECYMGRRRTFFNLDGGKLTCRAR